MSKDRAPIAATPSPRRLPAPKPPEVKRVAPESAQGLGGDHALSPPTPPEPPPRAGGFDLRHVVVTAPNEDAPPPLVHDVLSRPGIPLDAVTRAFFEPRFAAALPVWHLPPLHPTVAPRSLRLGAANHPLERDADRLAGDALRAPANADARRDLGRVRVHSDGVADAAARSIDALAYSVGDHIVFRGGQYAPHTSAGQQLLAHELAHVLQAGPVDVVRRQQPNVPAPDPNAGKVPFTIKIPPGISTKLAFLRYAETVIFGGVRNIGWDASAGAEQTLSDLTKHVGETMTFYVSPGLLAKAGAPKPSAEEKAADDKSYWALTAGDRDAINAEIDRRYYASTAEAPGTKIGAGETGKKDIWNSFRAQVLADKKKLDALPDTIKNFVGGTANFTPDKYPILLRLADKLLPLSSADLADYKSKVTANTTDLAVLEASLDRWLKEKAEREKERTARETIVTKLFGAEDVYQQYLTFKSKIGEPARLEQKARDKTVQGAGHEANELRAEATKWRDQILPKMYRDLVAALKALGFNSIDEFEKYISDYEAAFVKETAAIAEDLLRQYEHKLFEAEKRYSSTYEVEGMLYAFSLTGAPQNRKWALESQAEANKLQQQASFQSVQGNQGVSNQLSSASAKKAEEARGLAQLATQQAQQFRASYPDPLLKDKSFPLAAIAPFATINPNVPAAQSVLLGYVKEQRASVAKVREGLTKDPRMVYKLDDLMKLSYERQGIIPGTIFDTIITKNRKAYVGEELINKLALALVGLILTVLVPGSGIVLGAFLAVGAAGINTYALLKEYEEYEIGHAAAGVGFLSKDPSFTWVIVAAVGTAVDIAVAFAAVTKMAGAVRTFNATKDVVEFEKELNTIAGLNKQIQANAVRAAAAEAKYAQAMESLVASGSTLNAAIIPGLNTIPHYASLAYFAAKRGVIAFRTWLLELEGARVITAAKGLKPEELTALKTAWEQGQKYARELEQNLPKLEIAIKEFRAETGIARTVTPQGVQGGTSAAAKVEIEGVSALPFKEGSTKTKGASAATVVNNPRYASPQKFGGTKNHAEQNVLGDIADSIDAAKGFTTAQKGVPKPQVTGTMYLHVEQEVCSACRQGLDNIEKLPGVVKQFSSEFPNVTLVITDMRKQEVLFVRGGKVFKM